jgi:hypothetical protein
MRTLAGAQNTRTLVIGVQNVHRNQKPEEWTGKPAQCQKVLDGFAAATHEMAQGAEAKMKWSKGLLKRFETFYSQAGRRSDGGCTGDLALEHFAKILNQGIPGIAGMCFKLPARLETSSGCHGQPRSRQVWGYTTSLGIEEVCLHAAGQHRPDIAAVRQGWRGRLVREAPYRFRPDARCSRRFLEFTRRPDMRPPARRGSSSSPTREDY